MYVRKPLTPEQREIRNLYLREWRAKRKARKTGKVNGAVSEQRKVQAVAVAAKMGENPHIRVSDAMREVGLSEHLATHPAQLINTPEWAEVLDEYLPRVELGQVHRGLLRASRIDHLVFTKDGEPSDEEIGLMLQEVNCKVRKIVHSEQARHVYFFAPDNRARKEALEMAYKLRGDFAGDKAAVAFSLAALASYRDTPNNTLPTSAPVALPPAQGSAPKLPRSV